MMDQPPCPILFSARLRIRPVLPVDHQGLFEMWHEAGAAETGGFDVPVTLEDIAGSVAYFKTLNESGFYYKWVIESLQGDEFLGDLELYPLKPQVRPWVEWGIGYCLKKSARHMGYMKEALARVLDFAFNDRLVWRIKADVLANNEVSIRLLEENGFRMEGVQIGKSVANGAASDMNLYGLTREMRRQSRHAIG